MSQTNIITKETISRLVRDIKDITNNPLSDHGIYYKHDEEDMLKGLALIVGPEDTPYFGGYYLFDVQYPHNYPYSPPTITFCTNNGLVRFNPNLYIGGKVCISILNTWRGEQWTSCQTISTVLLSLSSLLCKSPLLNEPGCRPGHMDELNYIKIIEYANVEVAICDIINKHAQRYHVRFDVFTEDMNRHFIKNYDAIMQFLTRRHSESGGRAYIVSTTLYNMRVTINYKTLINKLQICYAPFAEKSTDLKKEEDTQKHSGDRI